MLNSIPFLIFLHIFNTEIRTQVNNFFKLVDAKCMDDNMEALADEVDVIFTATPQGLCASLINEGILSKAKVLINICIFLVNITS